MKCVKVYGLFLVCLFLFHAEARAQSVECPKDLICLTKEQANINRDKLIELDGLKTKTIPALEAQVLAEKTNVLTAQNTAAKNEADLRKENVELLVKVGTLTGQLIGVEGERTRLIAQVEFLNKNGRQKCQPFSICF
jgi:hypothetical protein